MTESFADGALTLTRGRVARLTLDAPARRNAMNRAMWAAIPEVCAAVAADAGVRVLTLAGAGETFCAGADISEFSVVYAAPEVTAAYNATIRRAMAALRALPCPVIAVVRGACVGGGCGLALACDLRFAATDARFAIPPARLGIAYPPEDTWALVQAVGAARAKDMLISARMVDAEEALRIGLVDRLCADPEAEAAAYAESVAGNAPASVRLAKAMVNGLTAPAVDPALQAAFEGIFAGPDFAEGRAAFVEKRKPRF